MKKLIILFIFILFLGNISALCEEGQIDINNAQKEGLIQIIYIGEVRANELINLRPFESIDELIKISGIGNITLNKIKEQGLACVEQTKNETEKAEETAKSQDIEEETFLQASETEADKPKEPVTFNTINLNPKDIKSSNGEEKSESIGNYAIYGFTIFCILIAVLFMLKIRKRKLSEFK